MNNNNNDGIGLIILGSCYAEINTKVEKFLNKDTIFPDYQDIHKLVQHCNEKYGYKLGYVL